MDVNGMKWYITVYSSWLRIHRNHHRLGCPQLDDQRCGESKGNLAARSLDITRPKNVCLALCECLPSGKRLHNYGKIHLFLMGPKPLWFQGSSTPYEALLGNLLRANVWKGHDNAPLLQPQVYTCWNVLREIQEARGKHPLHSFTGCMGGEIDIDSPSMTEASC